MDMMMNMKKLGGKITKKTTYPPYLRYIINISPVDVCISGENLDISRGCGFGGDIQLGRGTKIEKNSHLYGNIETGPRVCIKKGADINGTVKIEKGTRLQENIDIAGNISFGKFSAIARRSTFMSNNHPVCKPSMQFYFNKEVINQEFKSISKGPITIGNDVWIGAETIVLSGVTVGDGAIIGAGSVVTKDVPPYSIAAGAPARQREWRFEEKTREQLQEIRWWDWDDEKIRRNEKFFSTDLTNIDDIMHLIE